MKTPNQVVGERVRTLRRVRGLSQRDLAARVQELGVRIHHPGIGKVEQGQRRLDVSELFAFAYALDVSPMHLMVPADDDAQGVAVTPQIIVQRSGNLRRWIRGHIPISGQDAGRFYHIADPPPEGDYDAFMAEKVEHNRLVDAADDLRDAVVRRDPADIVKGLREVFRRAHDVARQFLSEEQEDRLIHGIEAFEGGEA